jgi:Mn2+/Fe2+ NRAMP family transporter
MNPAKTSSPLISLTPGSIVISLFIAVMVAYGLTAAFVTGPAMREAAQQQLAQKIADENRAFCERFGMQVGSSEFAVCSQELAIVRQKQTDRDNEAAQGLL